MTAGEVVVEPVDPAKARRIIWLALLVLGGLQAWTARFTTTPDGMSYADLSDAVVNGHLGQIVNAYWSPLYPALFGGLRLILRPGPYWEFAAMHLLNFLLFAASIAAFDYFLRALAAAAAAWGQHRLSTTAGLVAAYTIFGGLSLMMTPLMLPTPDLLVTTACFLVFGALLRLRDNPAERRHAASLGLALAMGALAKSFLIPWSVVVLIVAWLATRRSGPRATALAVGAWIVVVGPWCAALSAHQHHLTFGDTGRLTYIWNVNRVESPSLKVMPHGATTPPIDSIFPGLAVTPDARGTNPVWFDPSRWYTGLTPRWDLERELQTFSQTVTEFFATMAPLLVLVWFAVAVATREARALWWRRMWIVALPSLVAMGAYSLVLVTTRYIAPFLMALSVAVYFLLPWPSRLTPARVLIGLGVPLLIVVSRPEGGLILNYLNVALSSVLFAWAFRRRGPGVMIAAGIVGGLVVELLLPASLRSFGIIGAAVILVLYWASAARAIRTHEPHRFSVVARRGLLVANGLILALVFGLKYQSSIVPAPTVGREANESWIVAEAMRKAGVGPGGKIAIVGSPFEAYWARTGRLQIVGVVPPLRVHDFQTLASDRRDAVYRSFAAAGASVIVAQSLLPPIAGDSTWRPYDYVGWVKRLGER